MRFFDDPGKALQQMEDELLEEDWDEEDVDGDDEDFQILTAAAAARSTTPWTLTARSTTARKPTTPITRKIILPTAKAGKSSGRKVPAVFRCCSLGNWPVSPASSGGGSNG